MSRIGKKPISLPSDVEITVADANTVTVKGPKGSLSYSFNDDMTITVADGTLEVERPSETKFHKAIHGTTRALINNMIIGVTVGFKKELKIRRAVLAGTDIPINKMKSPDGSQTYELWTVGNGQMLKVQGLPN